MKIALVHDWLDKYGGAERVVNSLDQFINFDYFIAYADVMTDADKKLMFNGKIPSVIKSNKLSLLKDKFRFTLPLFPYVTKQFNKQVSGIPVDLIISSSWCLSKGFKAAQAKHVCYMQSRNFKYVWEEYDNYFKGTLGSLFSPFRKYLQDFDVRMAKNPDFLIANSKYVQNWIQKNYQRSSTVIYPPVFIDQFSVRSSSIQESDYFVTVGRLVQYKRFDLVIKACIQMNKKLIIIGDGVQRKELEKLAKGHDNIIFKGYLNSQEINHYISNARGFVFSSMEDFGIAPVEAQACGTPVIAYGEGGVKETIVENKTGIYFKKQTVEDIVEALEKFENVIQYFDPIEIRKNAERFSPEIFKENMQQFLKTNQLI